MENPEHQNFLRHLGQRVRLARKEKGLSMENLAYKAEIEYRQLGRIERGEGNFTIISLLRIADALEIEPSLFFDFD